MEDNTKQNVLIWSILAVNIITLVIMSVVAFVGWDTMNSKVDQQLLDSKSKKTDVVVDLQDQQQGTTTQQTATDCDLNKDGKVDSVETNMCGKAGTQQAPSGDATGKGKCGDGTCDSFEKANPKVCPTDCK